MTSKSTFVRISTPKSLLISLLGLAISAAPFVKPTILPVALEHSPWPSLAIGLIGLALLRASRAAMEFRAEVADEKLVETARNAKFIMKNALRCLGFGYLVAIVYIIDGISKYKTDYGDFTVNFRLAVFLILIIYIVATILGCVYQFRFVERGRQV